MATKIFNLTDDQFNLFQQVHTKHMLCMGTQMRREYDLSNIKKVVWDKKDKCLKVYWENGEWLHYTTNGVWY